MTKDLSNLYLNGNMHTADALASVREQIAELKKIEVELRDEILSQPHDRVGDMHKAEVVLSAQNRICQDKIKELIGDVDLVKKPIEVTVVRLHKIGARR
jgi:hypothetical protein